MGSKLLLITLLLINVIAAEYLYYTLTPDVNMQFNTSAWCMRTCFELNNTIEVIITKDVTPYTYGQYENNGVYGVAIRQTNQVAIKRTTNMDQMLNTITHELLHHYFWDRNVSGHTREFQQKYNEVIYNGNK